MAEDIQNRSDAIAAEHIRAQLRKLLLSGGFLRAPRMQRFLTFVVERKLSGEDPAEGLKETVIGVGVFDRSPDYDPKGDPVVRVEARRLRAKLDEYYAGPGELDGIRILIPKGSYVPAWHRQQSPVPDPVPEIQPRPRPLRIAVVPALVLTFALAAWWLMARRSEAGATLKSFKAGRIHSLAVLPFRNLTPNTTQSYLPSGLTDELTSELAKISGLKVISRTSAQAYAETGKSLPEIARELKVDSIVEGSVTNLHNRVRVSAQLIQASTDSHLWVDTYERSADDVFDLQRDIAKAIAHQVGVAVNAESGTLSRTPGPEAYDAYLRGRFFWNKRTAQGVEKSIPYFERAIQIDPEFGKAYAALGDSYVVLGADSGISIDQSFAKARQAAQRALQLDPDLAEAHTVLAAIYATYDWNWPAATQEYLRAIQSNDSYATAHHWYSLHLSRLGKRQEAEREIQRAAELDPVSLIINTDAAQTSYWARNTAKALLRTQKVLDLDPNFTQAHLVLGKVYEQAGRYKEALSEYRLCDGALAAEPEIAFFQAHALALLGRKQEALRLAQTAQASQTARPISGVGASFVFCALGQPREAMDLLDKAYTQRGSGIDFIGAEPLFDGCRSDPSFRALLARLRLPQQTQAK